ncbi:hypothetical protein [Neomoorella mulderi]|uniref:Thioredoxin n=1 Tax=Moorella mulderi DSM 14980 TaxID=1122241 RepID=A0A151AWJ8_9FIRM|nr:hypothetical protein [Moorella mulderi]KYH31787.1 hypothetical protein MOMUL_19300 [Moorella mulderi DSM 14980]
MLPVVAAIRDEYQAKINCYFYEEKEVAQDALMVDILKEGLPRVLILNKKGVLVKDMGGLITKEEIVSELNQQI